MISLSFTIASSRALTDLSLPTSRGTTIEGKTTTPRRGSNGNCIWDLLFADFTLTAVDTGFTSVTCRIHSVTQKYSQEIRNQPGDSFCYNLEHSGASPFPPYRRPKKPASVKSSRLTAAAPGDNNTL